MAASLIKNPLPDPTEPPAGAETPIAEKILKRFERAEQKRLLWETILDQCYQYSMPDRPGFKGEPNPGESRADIVYDDTAQQGLEEFAARIQDGVVPIYTRWADLAPGPDFEGGTDDEEQQIKAGLQEISELLFEIFSTSNFNNAVNEVFKDVGVSTGAMLIEEGDALHPIKFSAVPLSAIYLDNGPHGEVDGRFRRLKKRLTDIKIEWPDAKIPSDMQSKGTENPEHEFELIESITRNWAEKGTPTWQHMMIEAGTKEVLFNDPLRGEGSNPWVTPRWSCCAGETYGRGPVMMTLPSIKTLNLTVQLILENAEMQIAGLYKSDDDGLVNFDTVQLLPGTVIPHEPGQVGLQPITPSGNVDFSRFILEEMRHNVRKALFNDTLGAPEGTPMSATEVAERMGDLARRTGPAFGRLQSEFVEPLIRRCLFILKKRGLIQIPRVNNRAVKVVSISPLAQAQHLRDISLADRFIEQMNARFGPEMTNIVIDANETAKYFHSKYGLPVDIIRSENDQRQMLQQGIDFAQQGAPPAIGEGET